MIQSMTGYGQAIQSCGNYRLHIELKSVNHRYLDLYIRLPREWLHMEDALKSILRSSLQRGKIEMFVVIDREAGRGHIAEVDDSLAAAYLQAARQLQANLDLNGSLTIQDLLQLPDVVRIKDGLNSDEANEICEQLLVCTQAALKDLLIMRNQEGRTLQADLSGKIHRLELIRHTMQQYAPEINENYRKKLTVRMQALLAEAPVDEQRILQEAAIFADRSNIDEELTRLESHFQQFSLLLKSKESIGRKLDFLLQEMNREVNTVCTKANDTKLAGQMIDVKAELEKIREQVQNIQ